MIVTSLSQGETTIKIRPTFHKFINTHGQHTTFITNGLHLRYKTDLKSSPLNFNRNMTLKECQQWRATPWQNTNCKMMQISKKLCSMTIICRKSAKTYSGGFPCCIQIFLLLVNCLLKMSTRRSPPESGPELKRQTWRSTTTMNVCFFFIYKNSFLIKH
jgi:hypothetical protein